MIWQNSNLENKIINQKEKLYGLGFGFGILTKAGLLKFNYANGKSENQKTDRQYPAQQYQQMF